MAEAVKFINSLFCDYIFLFGFFWCISVPIGLIFTAIACVFKKATYRILCSILAILFLFPPIFAFIISCKQEK